MYKFFRFVFYSKFRRPVSTIELYACDKRAALAHAKMKCLDENVRGYMVQEHKLDRAFCISEIEKNDYSMRIGACGLSFLCDGTIDVWDWNGNHTIHTDVLDAIDTFIMGVNSIGR